MIRKRLNFNTVTNESKTFARKFLLEYNILVVFTLNDSWADCKKSTVGLETDVPLNEFYSLMFHELSHILAYRSKKFYKYHHDKASNEYMWKHGLRIERWIDKRAKSMMNLYMPDMKFVPAYRNEESLNSYYEWLKEHYPITNEADKGAKK